jgi:hypothetical protein
MMIDGHLHADFAVLANSFVDRVLKHLCCFCSVYGGCRHSSVPLSSSHWNPYALFSKTGSSVSHTPDKGVALAHWLSNIDSQ